MRNACLAVGLLASALTLAAQTGKDWQASFNVDKRNLGTRGSNPYFNLTPGYVLSFATGKETDTLTVLSETKMIDGVECRIVEDREMKNGQIVEVTRDYFAIDSVSNDVYYMGEDVDAYKNGKVATHGGSWLSGVEGAKFGLFLPASPKVGQRFYQEHAPGVAMDRVEVTAVDERVSTPAGNFDKCVHIVETTPVEPLAKDHKVFCPGVGMVRDGKMSLVKYGSR